MNAMTLSGKFFSGSITVPSRLGYTSLVFPSNFSDSDSLALTLKNHERSNSATVPSIESSAPAERAARLRAHPHYLRGYTRAPGQKDRDAQG